jgi:WD40 repeat protein
VTEFFEVISQSGPHIYHSALQLAPQSSVVRKLYGQQFCSSVSKVVTGVPSSWDSCTASAGATTEVWHAVWSPCGQFIAASLVGRIEVRDSSTLERVSVLKHPGNLAEATPESLAFSPDGRLIACTYYWPVPTTL